MIAQMVYQEGTDVLTGTYTGTVTLISGIPYTISFEILRCDLGGDDEYVTGAFINGENVLYDGECNPIGADNDCTFYRCIVDITFRTMTFDATSVDLSISLTEHASSCKCNIDENPMHWDCFPHDDASQADATRVVAAGRFIFTPSTSQSK